MARFPTRFADSGEVYDGPTPQTSDSKIMDWLSDMRRDYKSSYTDLTNKRKVLREKEGREVGREGGRGAGGGREGEEGGREGEQRMASSVLVCVCVSVSEAVSVTKS